MNETYIIKEQVYINNNSYFKNKIKLVKNITDEYNCNNIWMFRSGSSVPIIETYLNKTLVRERCPPMLGETYICELYDSSNNEQFILHEDWIEKNK